MVNSTERVGLAAGLAGVATLGGLAAAGAARSATRRRIRRGQDPYQGIDFTTMYQDRASTVTAADGVQLAVRTVDLGGLEPDETPELTVIFVHGFSLRLASWHFQRYALAQLWADRRIRMVFYDNRGHGRSGEAPADTCTMQQLADDAVAILDATAPEGRVVLVGHSMGGMTLMALARRYPQLFAADGRIAGVALVATAASGLTEAGLGRGLRNPLLDGFAVAARNTPRVIEAGRDLTRLLLEPVLVAASFGPDFHSPAAGRAVEKMIQNTPIVTVVNFLNALERHDEWMGVPVIAQVPSVVVCGDEDRMTPLPNSLQLYGELGTDSRMEVVDGAGHMVQMEAPDRVTDAIADLVDRARPARPAPRRRWWQRRLRA
ncbi:putative hydrolase [Gordonia polyisoprenivorans NBRC 16320 = JCM 10675]|uniref:Alpha/beta hydrolase n=1 Tax=Gordonia polyisoprenivorans TaxID=84595 RepID=A0A846WJK5_9ACTN|nr:alpha/beta hydrolase [Gordonia polyisoprenivorans]OZC29760.1 alpha/beta hydrolase [Gordonia polyisoprenivorans]GAB21032.1 putative hydrolase [Gordonia polyisoprenivorans NBRC 16320 = JCM 10675]